MTNIYLSYNSIISSLGFGSSAVIENIKKGNSGITSINDKKLFEKSFYGSLVNKSELEDISSSLNIDSSYTALEQMMIIALKEVINASAIEINSSVGVVISTTKGNIDVLNEDSNFSKEYSYLSRLSDALFDYFQLANKPLVVSNACVSGILSISVAKRLIQEHKYKHVFVVSGDLVSKFVLSGFNSFQALSDAPCKPYSIDRSGINLGEAIACVLVTSDSRYLNEESVELLGDATCNDANHISGPSKTGEGLYRAVKNALMEAQIKNDTIDYISAHGTATEFNDEMEAIAFNRLGLQNIPLNSLKGYFGHTLGSSGLVETIVGMYSLKQNLLIKSEGFTNLGVSKSLNIIEQTEQKELNYFLKTASGFGGANTAIVLKKVS